MEAWSLTDTGRVRKENQDSVYLYLWHDERQALGLICDGMGGANAGNVASAMAVSVISEEIKKSIKPNMSMAYMKSILVSSVIEANRQVYEKSMEVSDYFGMGTTVTAVLIDEHLALVVNVGDSRTYRIAGDEIVQVTRDHSIVADLLERGEITSEQFRTFPGKNIITRALGTEPDILCDTFELTLEEGDKLLLCSDGLSNLLEDREMIDVLKKAPNSESACRNLVKRANAAGGHDNISVVLIYV